MYRLEYWVGKKLKEIVVISAPKIYIYSTKKRLKNSTHKNGVLKVVKI
jgi:hypothetical protein